MLSNVKLTVDVNYLLGMFKVYHYTFSGNDLDERQRVFKKLIEDEKMAEQFDDVCQFSLREGV